MPTNIKIIPPSKNDLVEKVDDLKTANRELRLQSERNRREILQELSTVEAAKRGAENTFEENYIDPAAMSAGTSEVQFGAFCGLNIEFKHTPWTNTSRHGPNAKEKRYMEIFIRGNRINNDGTSSLNGAVYLPLYRNFYTDTLCKTYAYDPAWANDSDVRYYHRKVFVPTGQKPMFPLHFTGQGGAVIGIPSQAVQGQIWLDRSDPSFAVYDEPYTTSTKQYADIYETSYNTGIYNELGHRIGWQYGEGWKQLAWNQRDYFNPTDEEEKNIRDMSLDMYHNGRESEHTIDGDYADNVITGWENHNLDPVHEVFMLPYTKDLNFLLIIYTNLEYAVAVTRQSTEQHTSSITGTWPERPNDNGEKFRPESDWLQRPGVTTRTLKEVTPNPIIKWPTGLDLIAIDGENNNAFQMIDSHSAKIYSDFTTQYTLRINETGARQLQQIYLYQIKNGAVTEVDVPDQLREKAANLVTNLKGHSKTDIEGLDIDTRKSEWEVENAYEAYYRDDFGYIEYVGLFANYNSSPVQPERWWSNYTNDPPSSAFPLSSSIYENLGEYVYKSRKYKYGKTIDRSLPKGYGIGMIKYKNHFQQRYYGFQEVYSGEYTSFDNDNYFTPAVYGYLSGRAFPTAYYQTAQDALPIDRETFRPIVPDHYINMPYPGEVTCEMSYQPPISIHQGLGDSYFNASTDVEEIRNCTHFCYNWNRPDVCWDELVDLGISKDLLGERPGNPLESGGTVENDFDE